MKGAAASPELFFSSTTLQRRRTPASLHFLPGTTSTFHHLVFQVAAHEDPLRRVFGV